MGAFLLELASELNEKTLDTLVLHLLAILAGGPAHRSQPRDQTWVSCIVGRFFTAKPPRKFKLNFTVSIKITLVAVVGGWIEEEQVWRPEETSQTYCNSQGEAERQPELG